MIGRLRGRATDCASVRPRKSLVPATKSDSRTLIPTTISRWRSMAARVAATSTLLMSFNSPFCWSLPVREMLISSRMRFGAAFATATPASMLSDPRDPASTIDVTPSRRHSAASSGSRTACVWMSMRPGTTSLPPASNVSAAELAAMSGRIAAILPSLTATSATRSKRRDGSMTRPPLMTRSYCAARRSGSLARLESAAAPVAATERNLRRVSTPRIIASRVAPAPA